MYIYIALLGGMGLLCGKGWEWVGGVWVVDIQ
jgi:hypothetical protein